MTMPFGKYHGRTLDEIPPAYLWWLWDHVELFGQLRREVAQILELEAREKGHAKRDPHAQPFTLREQDAELFREVLNAGYRTLAIRLHPDQGGDGERMRRLNQLIERWRQQLN